MHSYERVGAVGELFQQRLTLGFFTLVPNGDFTTLRAPFVDEREQYFSNSLHPELYADRLTALSLAAGAAYEVLEHLSIGVAATLSLRAGVGADALRGRRGAARGHPHQLGREGERLGVTASGHRLQPDRALAPDGHAAHAAKSRARHDVQEGLQTNNPGWPGFGNRGFIVTGGIFVSLRM